MSADDPFRGLMDAVRDEDIAPLEADQIIKGTTLEPPTGQNWLVAFADPHWPLVFAILWVAWRDPDAAAKQWDRFRLWAGHIWRDPVQEQQAETLKRAESLVWQALRTGTLRAYGQPFQESDFVEIPDIHWRNLEWMTGYSKISVRNFGNTGPRYRCVEVDRIAIIELWPPHGEDVETVVAAPQASKPSRASDCEADSFA